MSDNLTDIGADPLKAAELAGWNKGLMKATEVLERAMGAVSVLLVVSDLEAELSWGRCMVFAIKDYIGKVEDIAVPPPTGNLEKQACSVCYGPESVPICDKCRASANRRNIEDAVRNGNGIYRFTLVDIIRADEDARTEERQKLLEIVESLGCDAETARKLNEAIRAREYGDDEEDGAADKQDGQ